jgi:hypothetical protein
MNSNIEYKIKKYKTKLLKCSENQKINMYRSKLMYYINALKGGEISTSTIIILPNELSKMISFAKKKISKDASYLICQIYGNLYVIDLLRKNVKNKIIIPNGTQIIDYEISPDNRLIAAVAKINNDNALFVWNIYEFYNNKNPENIFEAKIPVLKNVIVTDIKFSPDGLYIIIFTIKQVNGDIIESRIVVGTNSGILIEDEKILNIVGQRYMSKNDLAFKLASNSNFYDLIALEYISYHHPSGKFSSGVYNNIKYRTMDGSIVALKYGYNKFLICVQDGKEYSCSILKGKHEENTLFFGPDYIIIIDSGKIDSIEGDLELYLKKKGKFNFNKPDYKHQLIPNRQKYHKISDDYLLKSLRIIKDEENEIITAFYGNIVKIINTASIVNKLRNGIYPPWDKELYDTIEKIYEEYEKDNKDTDEDNDNEQNKTTQLQTQKPLPPSHPVINATKTQSKPTQTQQQLPKLAQQTKSYAEIVKGTQK